MWKLDVVRNGEVIEEHTGIKIESVEFDVSGVGTEYGYEASDRDGKLVDRITSGAYYRAPKVTFDDDFVCIRGIWVQNTRRWGFIHGIRDKGGHYTNVEELAKGYDDPRARREWNLRPFTGQPSIIPR